MHDYIKIKHELKGGMALAKKTGVLGRSAIPGPKKSSSSKKLPVKRKLDTHPPSDNTEEIHKRLRCKSKKNKNVALDVYAL